MKAAAIVAAAGAGERMAAATRKQYLVLEGLPVLVRSLNLFLQHGAVIEVIAVIPGGEAKQAADLLGAYFSLEKIRLVEGGASRRESVSRGLDALSTKAELVCIHDAARPLASAVLLDRLLEAAARFGAAVPVIKLNDTVKIVNNNVINNNEGFVVSTPQRENLRLVQTPQVFRRDLIISAYEEARKNNTAATDDSSLVELLGKPVATVPGETANLKITAPADLLLASLLLKGAQL